MNYSWMRMQVTKADVSLFFHIRIIVISIKTEFNATFFLYNECLAPKTTSGIGLCRSVAHKVAYRS